MIQQLRWSLKYGIELRYWYKDVGLIVLAFFHQDAN